MVGLFLVAATWMSAWLNTPRFQGDTLEIWRERLSSPDLEQRRLALESLHFLPATDEATLTRLSERLLAEDDDMTRATALATLSGLLATAREETEGPLPDVRRAILERYLIEGRQAEDPARRMRAAQALVRLTRVQMAEGATQTDRIEREYQPRVRDLLVERVGAERGTDRQELVRLLESIAPLPVEAEVPLLAAWRGESEEHRTRAVACLVNIPALSERAVPALLEQMATTHLSQPITAQLRRHPRAAIPGLIEALHPQDQRASVAQAILVQLRSPAIAALRRVLAETTGPRRVLIAQTLARCGPEGMTVLLPDLTSPNEEIAMQTQDVFLGAGAGARTFLRDRLGSTEGPQREAIQEVLNRLGSGGADKPQ